MEQLSHVQVTLCHMVADCHMYQSTEKRKVEGGGEIQGAKQGEELWNTESQQHVCVQERERERERKRERERES